MIYQRKGCFLRLFLHRTRIIVYFMWKIFYFSLTIYYLHTKYLGSKYVIYVNTGASNSLLFHTFHYFLSDIHKYFYFIHITHTQKIFLLNFVWCFGWYPMKILHGLNGSRCEKYGWSESALILPIHTQMRDVYTWHKDIIAVDTYETCVRMKNCMGFGCF